MTSTHGAAAYMELNEAHQQMVDRSVSRIVEVMEEAAADNIDGLIDAIPLDRPVAERIVYWAISAAFSLGPEQEESQP